MHAEGLETKGGPIMGRQEKLENTAKEKMGEAKEAAGEARDDQDLKDEGTVQRTKANLKQAGEKVKDAFR
jgi:uncharacterized protein YjbJ (UPF0337 family)